MGMQCSHLLLLVMTFYLKRDTPSHHIFNFSFNSLLLYQAHQWGISASRSLHGNFKGLLFQKTNCFW